MKFGNIQQRAKREWEAFSRLERPRILIGAVTCGRAAGALGVRATFEKELAGRSIAADLYDVGCFGMCYAEPLVEIGLPGGQRIMYKNVTEGMVAELVKDLIEEGNPRPDLALATLGDIAIEGIPEVSNLPMMESQVRIVLRNAGLIDPTNAYHYVARQGYSGLARALEMTPEEVIKEVKESGLRGRGGAGFSTGLKWEFARSSQSDAKYVICNADEGDPGAFMDRAVLESDPHAVLEGLTITAYAIGASRGYIYIRAEYPLAVERLRAAIRQMEELGFIGKNIMGSDFSFSVKIKEGAGAFVCGEETALMASIEGSRGMPRPRPPFPATSGLHGEPTNINNVETLANVSEILNRGAEWFTRYGTEKSRGTKTFALAGKINRTGLIEVPMGITLKDIIYNIGGGIPDGKKFKAVQTGGPSGGCLPEDLIELPVDFEELAKAGSIMGSGGMIVMDEDSCMVDIARYFIEFTHNESCGKCTPCRMGSQHLLRMLMEITEGNGTPEHIDALEKLGETIKSGALCGLGQTLPNPVLSTLRYFKEEFEEHIVQKRCDALVCKGIISSPCQYTCPIRQDAPCYIGYTAREEFDEAIEVIRRENPLPGICGRVCPHECEEKCEAGKYDDPIAIRALKRFAADYELKKGIKPEKAEVKYDEKVAIVGSGPAGLTAGYYLALEGYACTIFEALPVAGGMLVVGIPEYRLPRAIIRQEIEYIEKSGVEIRTGMALGKDFTVDKLFELGYKAVFLAVGAHKPIDPNIPGSGHPAVIDGVKFLRDLNLGKKVKLGERIAVIGGGNVAADSARSALRLGCKEVFIVYRRSREEMPALPEELRQLEEESINIQFLTAPVKAVEEDGEFKGVECLRMELGEPDDSGRRRPVPIEGSNFFIGCDNLVLAIGQKPDLAFNGDENLPVTKWGTIKADGETLMTEREGVFAGGDVVSGPDNVINAIAHGKRAAISIDQYLRGHEVIKEYEVVRPAVRVDAVELTDEEIERLARPVMPCKPGKDRIRSFIEVEQGFREDMAVIEAKRCLRCDIE
ncbi:MAG: NADH-quinone oxidoreductase subunit NuoF [Fidelibacterota bacterium]|nr:MAG: NADH-quinone oxidoreductase subunit NuoF [Candidatus Neomarinimicrobiota bacterium]